MPAHSFDFVAPFYDGLSRLVFGRAQEKAQLPHLPLLSPNDTVLIMGGGSGFILEQVLNYVSGGRVVYLEASEKMLQLARHRVAGLPNRSLVDFRWGTESNLGVTEQFDFILTHFFLDLFAPEYLTPLLNRLNRALKPGGWWLVSDFVYPQKGEPGSWMAPFLIPAMYKFFRLTCGISARQLPDWPRQLLALGLKSGKCTYFYRGLIGTMPFQKPG